MTERHYQLMARSAGTQFLRSQGAQIYTPTPYADARTQEPYYSQGNHLTSHYAQSATQIGGRSDYYLPSESHDIRAQLISERRSSLPGAYVDPNQAYADHVDPRALSVRPGMGEVLSYPSPQRTGHPQSSAAAFGSNDLLRARRAEIVAAYGHPPVGGRLGRLGNMDDPVMNKEGSVSAGAYVNGPRRLSGSSYEDQDLPISRVGTGQHGVLGSGAGARQGRDFERYLLAVQPDKLVRYAAACLSPEPAIKRARYAMMANNVAPPPEVDVYSNYRQAKLRRVGAVETKSRTDRPGVRPVVSGSGSGARREREKEPIRERRRKNDDRALESEKKNNSPGRANRVESSVPKSDEGNRVDQPRNSSHSSEGDPRSSGGKKGNAGPKRPSVQGRQLLESGHKEENHVDSDKDSELGSLGADLSDFEDEKIRNNKTKKKASEEPEAVIDAPLDGMIFGCSSVTFYECMRLQLFGLPTKNKDEVMRVAPGTKLFLFNFDTKELSGVFEAISYGGMMIQPDAFRDFGSFPAQVQVCCVEQCPNLRLIDFKPAIKDNFLNGFKFKFTLSGSQVRDLIRLFRRAAKFQHQHLHQRPQDGLVQRYLHEQIPPEDYLLRNSQRRRQTYTQHSQASGRSEEQGKGLNVFKGALDTRGNVITKLSDSAPSSSGVNEGLTSSEVPELSLNMRSPSKDPVAVEGEDQIVDKVEFSEVVMSDDVLDVEETGKIQNSAAGCEASAWDKEVKESLTEGSRHLLVDDTGEDYEENVCASPEYIVEISVEESRYTMSTLSDSDHAYDQRGQGEEGIIEQIETISSCRKGGDFGVPTSQLKEYAELPDKHEGNGKFTNVVKTSNKDETETCQFNDVICDPVSVSPEVAEAEEMDIGDDDIECEIPKYEEDAVNEMEVGDSDVPGVEDVEQVIEVGDNDVPSVEGVVQETQVENDIFEGEGLQNRYEEALELVIHNAGISVVDRKLPEAAVDEEDVIDDESSSEIPQMSESEGDGNEVMRSADGVSSETPEETEVEDEEVEAEALENFPACEPPQPLEQEKVLVKEPEKDVPFQVSEAREDGDVFNTAHHDLNSEQEIFPREIRTVNHEGGPVDDFGRCVYDDTESESEDLQNSDAGTEQRFLCKELNLQTW
ncbi:hypothetical protein Mapa_008715 [Marchantia paleacea]|nr:hypothetical protein Mapa_008715 [Marchantia paleacea]